MTPLRAAAVALAVLAATVGGSSGPLGGRTRLVLWSGGTTAAVVDLGTGRQSLRRLPGMKPGDFQPALLLVGRWLVYNGQRGVTAIASSSGGRPRVLGQADFFVPATDGRVLLVHSSKFWSGGALRVQPVSVSSGRRGRRLVLPRGAVVVEGSAAGLAIISRSKVLELWRPGTALRALARLRGIAGGAGFASDARIVVYGSGCRIAQATSFPAFAYDLCATLNVVDVVTQDRLAFPAPPATAGWVPDGFGVGQAIAPGDRMLVVGAALQPASSGQMQLYLLHLVSRASATEVPLSMAPVFARSAWSPDGAWLLYQGPDERLRALDVRSGQTYQLAFRCCEYVAMLAIHGRSR